MNTVFSYEEASRALDDKFSKLQTCRDIVSILERGEMAFYHHNPNDPDDRYVIGLESVGGFKFNFDTIWLIDCKIVTIRVSGNDPTFWGGSTSMIVIDDDFRILSEEDSLTKDLQSMMFMDGLK